MTSHVPFFKIISTYLAMLRIIFINKFTEKIELIGCTIGVVKRWCGSESVIEFNCCSTVRSELQLFVKFMSMPLLIGKISKNSKNSSVSLQRIPYGPINLQALSMLLNHLTLPYVIQISMIFQEHQQHIRKTVPLR